MSENRSTSSRSSLPRWIIALTIAIIFLIVSTLMNDQVRIGEFPLKSLLSGVSIFIVALAVKGISASRRSRSRASSEVGIESQIYNLTAAKAFRDLLVVLTLLASLSLLPVLDGWPTPLWIIAAIAIGALDYWGRHFVSIRELGVSDERN